MIIFSFSPYAKAETTTISISPFAGTVGSKVYLNATISEANGAYHLLWDSRVLDDYSGHAVGNAVNIEFLVPSAVAGNHNMTIVDVESGENATKTFSVLTSYSLKVSEPDLPRQLQQGDSIPINVSIAGGEATSGYVANITVKAPDNVSRTYFLNMFTSDVGSHNATITFPEDFDAKTNLVGKYHVFFNATLATETFFIGLTDKTEYHRLETVNIKALYAPMENIILGITGKNLIYSMNLTADGAGLVDFTTYSELLSNASIGVYMVNVTSLSGLTIKEPPDVQYFTIPGFSINVTARNLAGDPVKNVTVHVLENLKSIVDVTSGSDGLAPLKLEVGNYTAEAYFRNTKVGKGAISVASNGTLTSEGAIKVLDSESLDFACNLTNLRILVLSEDEIRIPGVVLYLEQEDLTFATDINGTAIASSLLPNASYNFNASRYGILFNETTIPALFVNGDVTAWFDVTIICPKRTLSVNVTDANQQPISNALIIAKDVIGGAQYDANTMDDGMATLRLILGQYIVEVHVDSIKLEEITVDLNETIVNAAVNCRLYGLSISLRIVDYFGQSIPNVNVTMQRLGLRYSKLAADGTASFDNAIGGEFQVAVRLTGQADPCIVLTRYFGSSTTTPVNVRVEKYVILGGMLVETSQLVAVMTILLAMALILSLELIRRRRHKPRKSES